MSDVPFRAGFAAILGKPNAGKSTLLNALVGTKIAAVSPLPQTTREKLAGIFSDDTRQIVFVDLPGLVEANDLLNTCLRENLQEGLEGVDVLVHLIDVNDPEPVTDDVAKVLAQVRVPMVLALNKIDGKRARVDAASFVGELKPPFDRARYAAVVALSALEGRGLKELVAAIHPLLPESPALYDPENLTDRDLRSLSAEMIREKAFTELHDELPYAIAVEIEEFKERKPPAKWYIRATLHVERDSQKGILIGEGGRTLKRIGNRARPDIERLCGAEVFLDLWVKVRANWRKNENDLRMFGLKQTKKRRRQ